MAKLGLLPMCTSIGNWDQQAAAIDEWREATRNGGGDDSGRSIPILVETIVAESDEEAISEACEYKTRLFRASLDHYTPHVTEWEKAGYSAHRAIFAGMERLTSPEGIVPWSDWQLIGSPETVASKIQRFIDIGFTSFILVFASPGVPVAVRHRWAERFAREVAPRFPSALGSRAVKASTQVTA
jgi:alkanesulfonate monooxygenase SsuD/methylene tetrahydromethanopterin reductase-like flavin-dependent oxidoreductase (luciferase family)